MLTLTSIRREPDALPWDDTASPDARLRAVAEQIAHMSQAGELDGLAQDTRAALAMFPMLMLSIAGDVAAERQERRFGGRCAMCNGGAFL